MKKIEDIVMDEDILFYVVENLMDNTFSIVFIFIIGYGKYEYQYEKAGELKNL